MEAGYAFAMGDYARVTGGEDSRAQRDAITAMFTPSGIIVGLHVGMAL